ncbi:hypothetical protein [Sphingomonas aerophila]|uniref:Uncharacterized protein n=1 Tax=Sphingomonas aerophila TaxID=1344948 RepID=A0A7W9BG79_9SPHN|nr:hypothetical protein [Sphingomonas aerophila]MBB5716641.1 hypothetical protein [Sphingomonas aerophila]
MPSINHNPGFDTYYGGVRPDRRDLLAACPELSADLPAGYPLADNEARARAKVGAPIPGKKVREAFIYFIDVPQVSADLRTAVVHMGYSCTGLCGADFEARYVRTAQGWRLQEAIRTLSVS